MSSINSPYVSNMTCFSKYRRLVYCIYGLILALSFSQNRWKIASGGHYTLFHRTMEGHVVGRIIASSQGNFFSHGGLLGTTYHKDTADWLRKWFRKHTRNNTVLNDFTFRGLLQYQIYARQVEVARDTAGQPRFTTYRSNPGVQGLIFAVLDQLPWPMFGLSSKLQIYRYINAFMLTICMLVFVRCVDRTLGSSAAVGSAFVILFSRWLTVFAPNLYWCIWVFFLPLVICFAFRGDRGRRVDRKRIAKYFGIAFLTGLTKCLIGGFEFATVSCLLPFVPLCFYAVAYRWNPRYVVVVTTTILSAVILSVLIAITILAAQLRAETGSWDVARSHILISFLKRTHGNPEKLPKVYAKSLKESTMSVLRTYLTGHYFEVRRSGSSGPLGVPYAVFPLCLMVCSILLAITEYRHRGATPRRLIAFHAMTWFAFLCPLSWYIVFKAHAQIHTTLDYVIWEIPFTPLVGAVAAATCPFLIATWRRPGDRNLNANESLDGIQDPSASPSDLSPSI